jgi:hypothetical protein
MRTLVAAVNVSDKAIEIEGLVFPPRKEFVFSIELTSLQFLKIRTDYRLKIGRPGTLTRYLDLGKQRAAEGREIVVSEKQEEEGIGGHMRKRVTIFNRHHFNIIEGEYTFPPGEEVIIEVELNSINFKNIRANKSLRVGKFDNAEYKNRHMSELAYPFNMVYDAYSQHRGNAYVRAIEALASPIMKHLPPGSTGFVYIPAAGYNLRFFSEMRINQQGKYPVGPKDIFMSHGIGDKDYWIASRIAGYEHVLVPGPAWKKRIEAGGYRGEIHIVGYTKLDPLFNGEYTQQKRNKLHVVWAPTHGYNGKHRSRSSYPQCLSLIKEIPSCYEKTMSLHPTSRMNIKNKQNITMQELLDADVVIADAGSTLYEAWALGKPVIFPDWICKKDVMAHFGPGNLEYQIYAKGIGYHAEDMPHLIQLIPIALKKGMQQAELEFMEAIFPSELRGKAGQKAAEVLMKISQA